MHLAFYIYNLWNLRWHHVNTSCRGARSENSQDIQGGKTDIGRESYCLNYMVEHLFNMACGGNQVRETEKEGLPFTINYSWNQGEEHSNFWRKDLLNGQVLMVLTAHKPCCSAFNMNSWEDKLKTLGIEVTADQWETLIQQAVLEPGMRTYILYNSRAIRIVIAAIVYMTLWLNLYSILHIFSVGPSWKVSILVTFVALVATVIIQVIIHHYQRKINVNTDMRLMAANEVFMKFGFLVGLTDILDKNCAVPQLWFVHFDVGPCLQSLTDSLATLKRSQESALKYSLDHFCIVVETAILPSWENQRRDPLEESLLLPERRKASKNFLTHREFLHLVPDRTPETIAQQLLTIFSSYYVRLLVSGQLPEVPSGPHKTLGHKPCLCQFVEAALLGKGFSGFQQR